jgi:uncharacterized protein YtpQ (UPF0354 family)
MQYQNRKYINETIAEKYENTRRKHNGKRVLLRIRMHSFSKKWKNSQKEDKYC